MHVQNREMVVPGQLVAEGQFILRGGVYREGDAVYSAVVGLTDFREKELRVIPLQGKYMPARGDVVVGIVVDMYMSGWTLDINSPYSGNLFAADFVGRKVDLSREDISKYLTVNDVAFLRVRDVDEDLDVMLEAGEPGLGKVTQGKLVEISPTKIPRVLGKKGSMLKILREVGNCKIIVGQNGRIIISGKDQKNVNAVVEAILMIEREAHTTGLTDRVRLLLEKEKSGGE
ncbi:MAG: exosome complex RNA-binding protein Rrp4 [Candidatus Hadarchaeota archaeon]